MDLRSFAKMIDFTAAKADSSEADIRKLVAEAKKYHFAVVGMLPGFIPLAKELLKGSDVGIGAPCGYPSGNERTFIKVVQARDMLAAGADELDMVANIGFLKSGRYREVMEDIKAVVDAADGTLLKVILEVTYLTDDEIKYGCDAAIEAGADFVKTGTGWAPNPTTVEHVKLIKDHIGNSIKLKAAGGIRTLDTCLTMIDMGVERFGIGMNSALRIMDEAEKYFNNENK